METEEYNAKDIIDLYNENILMTERIKKYASALAKIVYIENEWDTPIDFINDLKNIAKEALGL
jgi:hypothetical protein